MQGDSDGRGLHPTEMQFGDKFYYRRVAPCGAASTPCHAAPLGRVPIDHHMMVSRRDQRGLGFMSKKIIRPTTRRGNEAKAARQEIMQAAVPPTSRIKYRGAGATVPTSESQACSEPASLAATSSPVSRPVSGRENASDHRDASGRQSAYWVAAA